MQIVNFQCGKCGKLMGVSAEHLGAQVHCPHCHEVVQAPRASAPGPDPYSDIRIQIPDIKEQESIFEGTEEGQSEDLFGGPARPLVELPPESTPTLPPRDREPPAPTPPASTSYRSASPAAAAASAAMPDGREMHVAPGLADAEPEAGADELPATKLTPRQAGNSMLVPMLLVFLIPYCIFSTAYIVWILLNPRGFDPLERLPDTDKDGGPVRRLNPDTPLPGKLKTSLNRPIRVGDVEVTPLKVQLSSDGDLVLHVKMVNSSKDLEFNPLPDSYMHYSETGRKTPRPYSYLDGGQLGKAYGGFLRYFKGSPGQQQEESRGVIGPGQEVFIEITTAVKHRDALIKSMMSSRRPLVWRVHFRRGLVAVRDRNVPASAVIGVEFSTSAIEKGQG